MSISVFLLKEFLFVEKSDNHPYGDLAKSGYKPEIKYKSSIILLYVWLHNENHIYEFGNFYFFLSSLLATENLISQHYTFMLCKCPQPWGITGIRPPWLHRT
jgi:hypothetical protein